MNNGRDCAHGRQVGKCDTCDLIDAEQRILELEAQVEQLRKLAKEEAHNAYYEASDNNRCDRWADDFDEKIKTEFEAYWNQNKIDQLFHITPDQCLSDAKSQEFRAGYISALMTHTDEPLAWCEKQADEYASKQLKGE